MHQAEHVSPRLPRLPDMAAHARELARIAEGMHRVMCIFAVGVWAKVQSRPLLLAKPVKIQSEISGPSPWPWS